MKQFLSKVKQVKLPQAGHLILVAVAVVFVAVMLMSCQKSMTDEKGDIAAEVVERLMQINTEALDKLHLELDEIDQQLYATEEKLVKLEEVVTPALEWGEYAVEYEKALAEEGYSGRVWGDFQRTVAEQEYPGFSGSSWRTEVPPEAFVHLRNNLYWVTTIELLVEGYGDPNLKFSTVIKVTDLTLGTPTERDWEAIHRELEAQKSTLEQQWQSGLEKGNLSTQTFLGVIDYWEDWEIKHVDETTYGITGPGLGWAEELTTGEWTYHRDSGEIIPADSQSTALEEILSLHF